MNKIQIDFFKKKKEHFHKIMLVIRLSNMEVLLSILHVLNSYVSYITH